MNKTISRAQKSRGVGGNRTQRIVSREIKKYGFELTKPPKVRIAECPTYSMNIDNWIPTHNTLIEITRCVKDTKLFKIIIQAKNFKKQFPNQQFKVIITHQPRRDKSFSNHLKQSPHIDEVMVIYNDEYPDNKIATQKEILSELLKPFLDKLALNKLISDSSEINKTKHLSMEDDDRYIPYIDKVSKSLIESLGVDVKHFITTGSLNEKENENQLSFF